MRIKSWRIFFTYSGLNILLILNTIWFIICFSKNISLFIIMPIFFILLVIICVLIPLWLFHRSLLKNKQDELIKELRIINGKLYLGYLFTDIVLPIIVTSMLYMFVALLLGMSIDVYSNLPNLKDWTLFIISFLLALVVPFIFYLWKWIIEYPSKFNTQVNLFYDGINKLHSLYTLNRDKISNMEHEFYFELANLSEISLKIRNIINKIIRFSKDKDNFDKFSKNVISKLIYYKLYIKKISKYSLFFKKNLIIREFLCYVLLSSNLKLMFPKKETTE